MKVDTQEYKALKILSIMCGYKDVSIKKISHYDEVILWFTDTENGKVIKTPVYFPNEYNGFTAVILKWSDYDTSQKTEDLFSILYKDFLSAILGKTIFFYDKKPEKVKNNEIEFPKQSFQVPSSLEEFILMGSFYI